MLYNLDGTNCPSWENWVLFTPYYWAVINSREKSLTPTAMLKQSTRWGELPCDIKIWDVSPQRFSCLWLTWMHLPATFQGSSHLPLLSIGTNVAGNSSSPSQAQLFGRKWTSFVFFNFVDGLSQTCSQGSATTHRDSPLPWEGVALGFMPQCPAPGRDQLQGYPGAFSHAGLTQARWSKMSITALICSSSTITSACKIHGANK